jgi:hypothetical protein
MNESFSESRDSHSHPILECDENKQASYQELRQVCQEAFDLSAHIDSVLDELVRRETAGNMSEVIESEIERLLDELRSILKQDNYDYKIDQKTVASLNEFSSQIAVYAKTINHHAHLNRGAGLIERLDMLRRASCLINRAKVRIEELQRTNANAEDRNKPRSSRLQALLTGELDEISQKEYDRLKSEYDKENGKIESRSEKANKWRIRADKVLHAIEEKRFGELNQLLQPFEQAFGEYYPSTGIRAELESAYEKFVGRGTYVARYPAVKERLEREQAEAAEAAERNQKMDVLTGRLKTAGVLAIGTAVFVGGGVALYQSGNAHEAQSLSGNERNHEAIRESTESQKLQEAKLRVYRYLSQKGLARDTLTNAIVQADSLQALYQNTFPFIKPVEGQLAMRAEDGKPSPSHIIMAMHDDVDELADQVYQLEVKKSFVVEPGTIIHGMVKEGIVLNRKQYCNEGREMEISMDIGKGFRNTVADRYRVDACQKVRQALIAEMGKKEVDEAERTVILPMPNLALDENFRDRPVAESKVEVLGFVRHLQRENIIPDDADMSRIQNARTHQEFEVGLVELLGGDIYDTRIDEANTIQFSVRDEFKAGVRVIYGNQARAGVVHESHLNRYGRQNLPFHFSMGLPLDRYCGLDFDPDYRVVVQARKGADLSTHNADTAQYREEYCK